MRAGGRATFERSEREVPSTGRDGTGGASKGTACAPSYQSAGSHAVPVAYRTSYEGTVPSLSWRPASVNVNWTAVDEWITAFRSVTGPGAASGVWKVTTFETR